MKIKKHCNNCYIILKDNKEIHARKEIIDRDSYIYFVDVFVLVEVENNLCPIMEVYLVFHILSLV